MYVIYLPFLDSFYGGCEGKNLLVKDYSSCMHFNSLFCNDWYNALKDLVVNDISFVVLKVEFEKACLN